MLSANDSACIISVGKDDVHFKKSAPWKDSKLADSLPNQVASRKKVVNSASEAAGSKGSVPFFCNQAAAEQFFVHKFSTKLITGHRKTRHLPMYVHTFGNECT